MFVWCEAGNLKHCWSEDDASRAAGDETREQVHQAWERLFSEPFPGMEAAIDRCDGGDCMYYLFPEGRVLVASHDGDHLYTIRTGEKPEASTPVGNKDKREGGQNSVHDEVFEVQEGWYEGLEHCWSEDDASRAAGDETREQVNQAWERLFSEPFRGMEKAIDRYDGGDCLYYLFPKGRVLMVSFDGDHLYTIRTGAPAAPSSEEGDGEEEPLSPDQVEALEVMLTAVEEGQRVLLLEGAAGTGKTWLMKEFTRRLKKLGYEVRYMAPTGKAAYRLSRSVGMPASTIHSALYKSVFVKEDTDEPVFANPQPLAETPTAIICDEASMVNEVLHRDLVANLPDGCVLVYAGDPGQLDPTFGVWGPPFGHPTARLTTVHRQALESAVLRVATDLRNGAKLPTNSVGDGYLYRRGRLPDAAAWLIEQIEAGNDSVCLTYTNKVRTAINRLVRHQLGFRESAVVVPGERLVVLFNNRRAGKMNGETFDVAEVQDVGGALRLRTTQGATFYTHPDAVGADLQTFKAIQKRYATLTDTRLWVHVDHGYCLTVHKSQGSEFDHVMFVMNGTMRWMIQHNRMTYEDAQRMCYTALTRAKKTFTRLDAGRR